MTEPTFRIQGRRGHMHDARWTVETSYLSVAAKTHVTPRHDLADLVESILLALCRLATLTDHVRLVVERPGTGVDAADLGILDVDTHTGYLDLPTPAAIRDHLQRLMNLRDDGPGPSDRVALTTPATPALVDGDDLVAALGLRDDHQPVYLAGSSPFDHAFCPPEEVLRPSPPEDAHLLTDSDPRLATLIAPFPDLRELVRASGPSKWARTSAIIREIQEIRTNRGGATIEQEAESILRAQLEGRPATWVIAMGLRFGVDGDRIWQLRDVGALISVSAERVRQVQTTITQPREALWAPAADAAVAIIDHTTPCAPSELTEAFDAAGISEVPLWHAGPLRSVLQLTGRNIDLIEMDGLIGASDRVRDFKRIFATARTLSNMSGLCHINEVRARLVETGEPMTTQAVERTLRSSDKVHWLDSESLWVVHAAGRNRLVNTSLRILAVQQPQTLQDLHEGVDRNFRWRSSTGGKALITPDPELLELFCSSHPAFLVAGDGAIRAAVATDINDLGAEKLAMVGVFRAEPEGLLDRNSVMRACREVGMSTSTASVFLTYGECFKNFGHNVWGIRGSDVTSEMVDRVRAHAHATRVAHDRRKKRGHTDSGRPWMATKITPTILYSGVITSDWAAGSLGDEGFDVVDLVDGESIGTCKFSGLFNYGYNQILRKHEAKVGDVMRVIIDRITAIAYVEIGGDELLDEPFDF